MSNRNIIINKRKKEVITKTCNLHERKVHIRKKGKVYIPNFSGKRKVGILYFRE